MNRHGFQRHLRYICTADQFITLHIRQMFVGDEGAIAVHIPRHMDKAKAIRDLIVAMRQIIRIA